MITDDWINFGFWIAGIFAQLGISGIIPEWFSIDALTLAKVFRMMGSVSVWFPVPLVMTIVGAVLLSWLTGFGIKFVRALAAHIPFIGGAG